MHALIDFHWMVPGYTGGIEVQARAFLDTLLRIDFENIYTILLPIEACYDFDTTGHKNIHIIPVDGPGYYFQKLYWYLFDRKKFVNNQPWERYYWDAQVVYSFAGYFKPHSTPAATLVTIPDIQHEYYPDLFSPTELEKRRHTFQSAIQHATHLCTISQFTRQTVIDKLHVSPEEITVTLLAAHPEFERLSRNQVQLPDVLAQFNLAPGYFFYPANTWRHKNHAVLLKALHILKSQGLPFHLVCTGSAKEAHTDLIRLVNEHGLNDQVHFLGYCSMEEIAGLYVHARALVFPSLFEGFGMPLIEAMLFNCPVISSNATSLPEIGGNAAYYVDPHSHEELAKAMLDLSANPRLREELQEKGNERVKNFSWLNYTTTLVRLLGTLSGGMRRVNDA